MVLYQTVSDRDNADYIEDNAPFRCERKDAWLGEGYYFWDTLIKNAYWWGEIAYNNEYVITKFSCDYNPERCFDLHGNMEHVKFLRENFELLKKEKIANNTTTVPQLIEFLKKNTDIVNMYDCIRACGIKSRSSNNVTMLFNNSLKAYLDFFPVVQLCLFRKNSFNLTRGQIVYPTHYVKGYLV